MRAINKTILKRIQEIKNSGTQVRNIITDKALAAFLQVDQDTVGAWRKNGVIPYRTSENAPKYPIYKLKEVIAALEAHSEKTPYEKKLEEVDRQLNMVELEQRIRELSAKIDELSKNRE
jgi:phage terminase Nu1 subunit (DNA packaging protein)